MTQSLFTITVFLWIIISIQSFTWLKTNRKVIPSFPIKTNTCDFYEDEYNTNIRKCIASGFFFNASKWYATGLYKTVKNAHTVMIHPTSYLFKDQPLMVVYHELVFTTKEFMRNVVEIKSDWLT